MISMILFSVGLWSSPDFVVARETCYVDEDADDGGDGSDDEPYREIEKALNKDCETIIVKEGSYDEDITIFADVTISGKGRDKVKITGSVLMKNGTTLNGVTVSGKDGIAVAENADVEIRDAAITGADIGIETVAGSGKITVRSVKIFGGKKGMYLQSGNSVKITGCEVYDNDEEGVDIRSDVSGTISDNSITDNGESGIEVILGKADLTISDNKIKSNKASGIATQYYKGTGKSGAVKIKSNTISSNRQYGINCKTPSGGNPGKDFWEASLNMSSNKLSDNKDGNFSAECSLSETTISDATMTQKQKEAAAKAKYEAEQKALAQAQRLKEASAQESQKNEEQKRVEEERQQAIAREQLQKNTELIETATAAVTRINVVYEQDRAAMENAQKRSAFVMFFIGPKKNELNIIASNANKYHEEIDIAQAAIMNMTDQNKKSELHAQIQNFIKKQEELAYFVQQQNEEFSLFGWMFGDSK